MITMRYADDFIVGFEHETDARRFLDEMRERLQEFALSLHSEKTRLIEFGRLAAANRKRRGLGKPETFAFLGFSVLQRHMERRETARRKQCRKAARKMRAGPAGSACRSRCAYRKSSPSILVMQSTQDRTRQNASLCLGGT
jgi:RNA-directed DNA polymerase